MSTLDIAMGVVYKLKEEVVDYIVQKKKAEPSLSCRRLVDVIKVDFGLKVSKSSVNEVIKHFQLSSPVGRHSSYKAPKNFAIPKEKKEVLFKNIAPFLAPENRLVLPQEIPVIIEAPAVAVCVEEKIAMPVERLAEPVVEKMLEEKKIDERPEEDFPVVHLPLDPLERGRAETEKKSVEIALLKFGEENKVQEIWGENKGPLYPNMGLFMVASLLWDAQRRPMIGEVVGSALGRSFDGKKPQVLEMALLYQALISKEAGAVSSDDGKALFDIYETSEREVSEWLSKVVVLKNDPGLSIALQATLDSIGVGVRAIKVVLRSGKIFYVDPLFLSYSEDLGALRKVQAPLFSVVDNVADSVVANVRPLVIGCLPFGLSDERTAGFLKTFDEDGDVERVDLLGCADETVLSLKEVPGARREFIAGVQLSEADYAKVDVEMITNSQLCTDPFSGQEFLALEGRFISELFPQGLRTILLKTKDGSQLFCLATNKMSKIDKILQSYVETGKDVTHHFEYKNSNNLPSIMGESVNFIANNNKVAPLSTLPAPWGVALEAFLTEFIQKNTFDLKSDALEALLRVSGYYQKTSQDVFIRFSSDQAGRFPDLLARFMKGLNLRGLVDYEGRRVHFSLDETKR